MIENFLIKKGANVPYLECVITKDGRVLSSVQTKVGGCAQETVDPNVLDLTGCTVAFEMVKCGRTPTPVSLQGTAEVVGDGKNGIVRFKWHVDDTGTPGTYYGTFIITKGSDVFRWPYHKESLLIGVIE